MSSFLSRGIDYLEDLGGKLRDLRGFRTLAHELIQNADDVPDTTRMAFDVGRHALVVDNDGVFSDCRHVEDDLCPWKAARGHMCDFHRLRKVASGDKRGEQGTTGAFGIGFTAVYQITDQPEVISGGRHWILREANEPHERVEICSGCQACEGRAGTRFIFPWALTPNSDLRRALRAEAVAADAPQRLSEELDHSLPVAMLFLKRLRTIEILRDSHSFRVFNRVDDGDSFILTDGTHERDRVWHTISGDFNDRALELRRAHPGSIEHKRSSKVVLAIPAGSEPAGLLCACLPTEHNVGVPFHISADFFPTSDRKRVIFADDYQSDWNREALRAAARAIAGALPRLPALLGADRFWDLITKVEAVAEAARVGREEATLSSLWDEMSPRLRSEPVILTTGGDWVTPDDSVLLLQSQERSSIAVLEPLGLKIVHESLRPYFNLLRSDAVSVPLLDIERICSALVDRGLNRRTAFGDLPAPLQKESGRLALWNEITILFGRQKTKDVQANDELRLRKAVVAPGRDGALWPCGEIFAADRETILLFEALDLSIPFLSNETAFSALAQFCQPFDAAAAVSLLAEHGVQCAELWQQKRLPLDRLFEWFENRREQIVRKPLQGRLAALPIFPASGRLLPLDRVAIPGDFDDSLRLAEFIDLGALGGRRQFFLDLGIKALSFRTYAVTHVPGAFNDRSTSAEKKRAAVLLLAQRASELKDDAEVRRVLAGTALVECSGGEWRRPFQCYFDAPSVRECIGEAARFAVLPAEHATSVREFYQWLGVRPEPTFADLATRARQLAGTPYSEDSVRQVQGILAHLAKRVQADDRPAEILALRNEKWLPARGRTDRWYGAGELHAPFRAHLFQSAASFLDSTVQNRDLLELLGVSIEPTPGLVVKHLLNCVAQAAPVNNEVYRFLNENAGDLALDRLKGKRCLWFDGGYHFPDQAFWTEHPFGRYRFRLSQGFLAFGELLNRLGVRNAPEWQDGLAVLREVSDEFGATNTALDAEAHDVVMACWRMLESGLSDDLAKDELAALHSVKSVPNGDRVLAPPEWMFFENRAGLAAKFGQFLAKNVILPPLGAANAYAAGGVRQLGSAVDLELLECEDPAPDSAMAERILGRRNEIARVVAAQAPSAVAVSALSHLAGLTFAGCKTLELRYRLRAFNREVLSEPERVPALYQADQRTLLFVKLDGAAPWAAIARELAIALLPEEDPGRVAAGFKEVVAAATVAEAAASLSELGFGQLNIAVSEPPPANEVAGELGVEGAGGDGAAAGAVGEIAAAGSPEALTPEDAIRRLLGGNAPPPTRPSGENGGEVAGASGKGGGRSRSGSIQVRPVLRSYLPAPKTGDGSDEDAEHAGDARSPVDVAGVRHVMQYEAACGRGPREMPHTNPGYDIESRDHEGRLVRFIEVKSFSGRWRNTYAVLSRPQFDKAQTSKDLFWLYVVERAEADDFEIHRIHNPVLKANRFMFDDGWSATEEPTRRAAGEEAELYGKD